MAKNKLTITKNGSIAKAKYYDTDIVKAYDRQVMLNSGGFKTASTKKNINRILDQFHIPMYVFQHEGQWLVANNGQTLPFEDNKTYNY